VFDEPVELKDSSWSLLKACSILSQELHREEIRKCGIPKLVFVPHFHVIWSYININNDDVDDG
jgi:hypothetical protein